jgi:hypothetical protein
MPEVLRQNNYFEFINIFTQSILSGILYSPESAWFYKHHCRGKHAISVESVQTVWIVS